jgi:beta-1,4-mannosyl-glycoprotein beta-1,4-N-acetylglucosaminyltransferase
MITDPVVLIMVKNEEPRMVDTLKPFVDAGYVNFAVYDTGSTDRTVEITQEYLREKNLKLKVDPFVPDEEYEDFPYGPFRNRALDYVDAEFKGIANFVIFMDCEWYINDARALADFVRTGTQGRSTFDLSIKEGANVHTQTRLTRVGCGNRYVGVIHEYLPHPFDDITVPNVFVKMSQSDYGHEKTLKRNERDVRVLKKEHEKSKDPRDLFYLGVTYLNMSLRNPLYRQVAIDTLFQRIAVDGSLSEKYVACLYLGGLLETGPPEKQDWAIAQQVYLDGYACCPHRAECLVKIAQHYQYKQIDLKYLFAKAACRVNAKNDAYFFEPHMHDFARWEQLSIAGLDLCYSGRGSDEILEEARTACMKALEVEQPDYLVDNLKKIEDRLYGSGILNLILYSEHRDCYRIMKHLLTRYMKDRGIDYYFYVFREDQTDEFVLDDHTLYIRGKETYTPGILDKTIKALEYVSKKRFKYVIRSNVTTLVDFDNLNKLLESQSVDYGGFISYDFRQIGFDIEDVYLGGQCLILSRSFVMDVIADQDVIRGYGRIDDEALGLYYNRVHKADRTRRVFGGSAWNTGTQSDEFVIYRNRQDDTQGVNTEPDPDRLKDVNNMLQVIVSLEKRKKLGLAELAYNEYCRSVSDVNEHLPRIAELVNGNVLQIGGTWNLAAAFAVVHKLPRGSTYTVVEDNYPPQSVLDRVKSLVQPRQFAFINENELTVDHSKVGVVRTTFIDGIHHYGAVKLELDALSKMTESWIILHDTEEPWGYADDPQRVIEYPSHIDRSKHGVNPAVHDFLLETEDWVMESEAKNNHGLIVLKRIKGEACPLEGSILSQSPDVSAKRNGRRIVDGFVFYNELDMLEYRLETMGPYVDAFVIVEATKTFAGRPKELVFKKHRGRYSKWASKIVHIIVDDMPEGTAWDREYHQRRRIHDGFQKLNLGQDDVVIISDVDEIVDSKLLESVRETGLIGFVNLQQTLYYYNVECRCAHPWTMAKMGNYGMYSQYPRCDRIREILYPQTKENAGWHLSYFGNTEFIVNKLEQFSHQEFNTEFHKDPERIRECIRDSKSLFGGNDYSHVSIGENPFPPPNLSLLKSLFRDEIMCEHVAFHYTESRICYVRRIVEEANGYPIRTDVFIHSNTQIDVSVFGEYTNGKLVVVVHDMTGKDPFKLTWMCRDLMKAQLNDYSVFMYTEDDILFYLESMEYWIQNHSVCVDNGYNLGFLRIEYDPKGDVYLSDLPKPMSRTLELDRTYAVNDVSPYTAMWIYDHREFAKFTNSHYYNPATIQGYFTREQSAIGLHGLWTKWYTATVIPLVNGELDERCRIHHMPNNYAQTNSPYGFGEVLYSDALKI